MVKLKTKFEYSKGTDWLAWCKTLLELYETSKYIRFDQSVYKYNFLNMKNWLLAHKFSGQEKLLHTLLLDAIVSADAQSPGAGVYVPWFIYNNCDLNYKTRLSSQEYLQLSTDHTGDAFVRELFETIHQNAGPLTKLIIKPSYEQDVILKYRNSFVFDMKLDPSFHRIIGNKKLISHSNPLVIMIEGAPETVAEIDPLLRENHQNKQPMLLIARNFPEEVSATLATNYLKGSLSVIPLKYGDTLDTINSAADITAITKGSLISGHFGDIITSAILDPDKRGTCDKIEWINNKLFIYKNVDVSRHLNNLTKKAKHTDNEELKDIYRNRILSLSNDAIEIIINKDEPYKIQTLDAVIKHYNGYVISGTLKTNLGYIPASFAEAASVSADTFKNKILNIGGFLMRVDDEVVVG